MTELFNAENAIALLTLTSLEIVLGIDNIVFISILTSKLPAEQQPRARRLGLALAMGMRIALLLAIGWVMGLTATLFEVFDHAVSGRDLILLIGGLFLLAKATWEIHDKLEGAVSEETSKRRSRRHAGFGAVLLQVALLDIVFSLDSVITAVGMAKSVVVMIVAVVAAVAVMMVFAKAVSDFVERHPTMKMLALSFLILVGVLLVADAFERHIDRGYVYFAMAFSLGVELLNLRVRAKARAVKLHGPQAE